MFDQPNSRSVSGHVRVQRGKRGDVYYAKWRGLDGRQRQRRLGRVWKEKGRPPDGYLTRRMAEAALRELLADAQRGVLPGVSRTGATFGDAVAEWLRYTEEDRRRRHSTVRDYAGVGRTLLADFGEDEPLERFTTERVESYRARLVREGRLSARTVNKRLVALHGIFRRAQKVWGLSTNPAAGVERQPLKRSGDFDVLEPDEVRLLALAAETEDDAAFLLVAAFTGLRLGEMLALTWRDVDFGKRLVRVRRSVTRGRVGAPKSGKVRSVPLIDEAARALDGLSRRERFTADDDLVFPSAAGGHRNDATLRRAFHEARERAGLRRVRLHDLRHTFGTLAVAAFPLSDVQAYMGHADVTTTMIYVHFRPAEDAAERLGRAIESRSAPLVREEVAA